MSGLTIAIFASGRGSNCAAILKAIESGRLDAKVGLILSDRSKAGVLEIARSYSIPWVVLSEKNFESRDEFVKAMSGCLEEHKIDTIVQAGYLKLIYPEIVRRYRGRILNIHPALLPSFGGKGFYGLRVHQAVIERGCKVTGVTVHIVDEEYDHGPIVAQEPVRVHDGDDAETLAHRVLEVEHELYPRVIQWMADGRLKVSGRRVRIAE